MRAEQRSVSAARIFCMATAVAIWMATSAFLPFSREVDEAMVERAVTGAEWLAETVIENPERRESAAGASGLRDWLLIAGGVTGANYDQFAAFLSANGYPAEEGAVEMWIEEFDMIAAAAAAHALGGTLRSVSEIEAELRTMPVVPLDEAGRRERRELLRERALAETLESERAAAAQAGARLARLRERANLGARQ